MTIDVVHDADSGDSGVDAVGVGSDALPPLPIDRLRFHAEALEPIRLPGYAGSAWRGLLGHSLRRSVCVTRAPTCEGCLLLRQCAYATFFETPPAPADIAARYSALPHPYVLEPEVDGRRVVEPGEPLALGINLIGPAADLAPHLIHALLGAGERGLGRAGGRFMLSAVTRERSLGTDDWERIYSSADGRLVRGESGAPLLPPCPPAVRLRLETPLRVKYRGRFVGPKHLTAGDLLRNLLIRIDLLLRLYGPAVGADRLDADALFAAVPDVTLGDADLHWHDWTRYSSRQQTHMQLGGLLGEISLGGDGLPRVWPLLWLGQWTHVGKGTSFGLGRYRLLG